MAWAKTSLLLTCTLVLYPPQTPQWFKAKSLQASAKMCFLAVFCPLVVFLSEMKTQISLDSQCTAVAKGLIFCWAVDDVTDVTCLF